MHYTGGAATMQARRKISYLDIPDARFLDRLSPETLSENLHHKDPTRIIKIGVILSNR